MDNEEIISQIEAMRRQESSAYACRDYFREQRSDECKFGTALPLRKRWSQKSREAAPVTPKCRSKMIEWCYQIVDRCGFDRESVIIAMNYLDRFLMTKAGAPALCDKNIFQLAALTCLYTAIKLFEPEVIGPALVSAISRGTYTEEDITDMEMVILSALEWRVQPPTASAFVRYFLHLVDIDEKTKEQTTGVCRVQVETAVYDSNLIEVKPSAIAAASILNAIDLMDEKALPVGPRCSLTHVLKMHGSVSNIYGEEMDGIRSKLLRGVNDEEYFNVQRSAAHKEPSAPSTSKTVQESSTFSPQSVDKGPGSIVGNAVSSLSSALNWNVNGHVWS